MWNPWNLIVFTAAVTTSLFSWDGASGHRIMYDSREFLMNVMENDEFWFPYLAVKIKINTAVVSTAALNVLKDLNTYAPQPGDEPLDRPHRSKPNGRKRKRNKRAARAMQRSIGLQPVVTAVALHVIADVVTGHHEESDATEFGLSALASAVKCNVMQHLVLQLQSVRLTPAADTYEKSVRLVAIWKNLVAYLDKLGRLKEPLNAEATLYQEWEKAAKEVAKGETTIHLEHVQRMVQDNLKSSCDTSTIEQILAELGFDMYTENWDSPDGVKAIFDKSRRMLDNMFRELPISTMGSELWDDFLPKPEEYHTMLNHQTNPPIVDIPSRTINIT